MAQNRFSQTPLDLFKITREVLISTNGPKIISWKWEATKTKQNHIEPKITKSHTKLSGDTHCVHCVIVVRLALIYSSNKRMSAHAKWLRHYSYEPYKLCHSRSSFRLVIIGNFWILPILPEKHFAWNRPATQRMDLINENHLASLLELSWINKSVFFVNTDIKSQIIAPA